MSFIEVHKHLLMRAKLVLLLVAFVFSAFRPGTDRNEGNEYQIKAMFVFNFIKYVEWPATNANTEFTIGVIGESEITEPLQRIALQKKVGEKKIVVRRLAVDDDAYCNIIIVSRSRSNKLDMLEKRYANKGVLVISDEATNPAAINLITIEGKVKFEINSAMAKNCGVKISSQLLTLAVAVH